MKTILHIDFDSFFASVEQECNPQLQGKPIGVTAAHSRSAIIAASKEAKAMGVRGGSSYFEAKKICPQIILTPAHFTRYFEISKEFITICRLYSPYLEVFSIDELFLDITTTAHLFGGVNMLLTRLKSHIRRKMGEIITVSIGVSHNKMLAKLASGMEKPNGITYITPENVDTVYSQAQLTDVCGIGHRIAKRLNMLGVGTLLELRALPYSSLEAEFGPHEARFLQDIAWARDSAEVVSFGKGIETKSVGRNYCLPRNETDKRLISQTMFELFEEVGIKLRRLNKKSRSFGVYLRGDISFAKRKTVDFYTDSGKEMFEALFNRIQPFKGLNPTIDMAYVRQISVWAGYLQDADNIPLSLFDISEKKHVLTQTIDTLNEKFGDHTIRNGFLLKAPKLTTVPNGFLADRWERQELTKLY